MDIEDIIFGLLITVNFVFLVLITEDISTVKENVENITNIENECIKINEKIYCEKENE